MFHPNLEAIVIGISPMRAIITSGGKIYIRRRGFQSAGSSDPRDSRRSRLQPGCDRKEVARIARHRGKVGWFAWMTII